MTDRDGRDRPTDGKAVSAGPAVAVAAELVGGADEDPELVGTTGRTIAGKELALALMFLIPAMFMLVGWLIYPVLFTVWRSLFDAGGDTFVGADNYADMFTRDATQTAIKNNLIWVIAAPTIAAAVGLVFAVLTERIQFGTAFKTVIFMPMAISFLAAGVVFRFVYDEDPDKGLANALMTAVTDVWQSPGEYVGARPRDTDAFAADNGAFTSSTSLRTGEATLVPLVAIAEDDIPDDAAPAARPPAAGEGEIAGTVWLDFTRGGEGEAGAIDASEVGLPEMKIEAVNAEGNAAASAKAGDDGIFVLTGLDPGEYRLRLASSNFDTPWTGLNWLGPGLVTPSVIGSFLWIWTGFAMVVIAAGLSSIPRETLEAARVDGANEWQVFRRVTAPLLWPVILVVVVTLMINVLKIFDLVLVVPPGNVQDDANVIALELWRVSFGGARDQGLGSALGVFLFVLVLPAMAFNIRRFRAEQD